MARAEASKQERMHIRLDTLTKQKLERAAGYVHKSLSEFVLSEALSGAEEVIQEHELIKLQAIDWEVFLTALEKPPQPTARLRQALAEHAKRVKR